jgi:hypothetical protein
MGPFTGAQGLSLQMKFNIEKNHIISKTDPNLIVKTRMQKKNDFLVKNPPFLERPAESNMKRLTV